MRRPGGWWRRKNTPEKVETYTRWSFHFFGVCEIGGIGLSTYGQVGPGLATVLSVMVVVHAAVCMATASRTLDWTLGRRPWPGRRLWTLGAVTALLAIAAVALVEHGPRGAEVDSAVLGVFVGVQGFGVGVLALGVHDRRRRVMGLVVGFSFGAGLVAFALGLSWLAALITACALVLGGAFLAFTAVFSVWLLKAVYALDEAKETRARLAVAEERLRFGRDLHDVMGRNLAVIALKSELAVQLSRRGRPEAVGQMIEAQRIAQESQREVRDVVRGYREVDLEVELAGARGVLSAAGIVAEVTGETAGLPAEVQSALGWVVREATTNVLRHGDAKRVAVAVRMPEGRVVLTVENDGVPDGTGPSADADAPAGTGGSGLAGLRERLSVVDGTLEAGTVRKGVFRVTAEVPLPPHAPAAREVAS
ncbi:sensor histidine kinase [Streptomyces sp. WAC 04229]|uniref:sensor histidine kinase n=1 Tax=Streptomyces sp. WAC 04229 TaxID=2203206 RepID=UPI000F747985|nr:sensor histidine kinase [Streptomyces sp. WAC 04229]RSN52127.1 sensor histidine kinase [Streptomyces sp. WAC 04229]